MDPNSLVDSCWGPTVGFVWARHLISTQLDSLAITLLAVFFIQYILIIQLNDCPAPGYNLSGKMGIYNKIASV